MKLGKLSILLFCSLYGRVIYEFVHLSALITYLAHVSAFLGDEDMPILAILVLQHQIQCFGQRQALMHSYQ